jgi:hypothetical protein
LLGAANRVAPKAMAYGHRDAKFVLNVHGRSDEAKDDQKGICLGAGFLYSQFSLCIGRRIRKLYDRG